MADPGTVGRPAVGGSAHAPRRLAKPTTYLLVLELAVLCALGWHVAQTGTSTDPVRSVAATFSVPGFMYGVFEDANVVHGAGDFEAMIQDVRARGLTSVLFTNNFVDRDEPLLDVADRLKFQVIFAPHGDLSADWWPDTVPASIEQARSVIYPLVDRLKDHPSLVGYNILDDAPDRLAPKAALAVQAFAERDPYHPAMPVIIRNNESVYAQSGSGAILTYAYPALANRPACNFYRLLAPPWEDDLIVTTMRRLSRLSEGHVPIWIILQTHGATTRYDPWSWALRQPTVEEVRLQNWLALGEGARGIFWFIYSSQQFWTGLRDNPALFGEVTDLAARVAPLGDLLASLHKDQDRFTIVTDGAVGREFQPYVSTLVTDSGKLYVIAANRSCSPETVAIGSTMPGVQLRNVERGDVYDLGAPISLRGGDGMLFEVLGAGALGANPSTP